MNSRPAYSQVAAAYAQAAGARATWLVRARNAFEVIAKTGMVGAHDRLVVYGDTVLDRCLDVHPWQNVSVVDELTCDAFMQAGTMPHAEEAERARLVPEGSPGSFLRWGVRSFARPTYAPSLARHRRPARFSSWTIRS